MNDVIQKAFIKFRFKKVVYEVKKGTMQVIGGIALIGVGGACIIFTGGAATPVVVAGYVAGGGTAAFGVAETSEDARKRIDNIDWSKVLDETGKLDWSKLSNEVGDDIAVQVKESANNTSYVKPSANGYDVPWSEVHWTDHGTSQFHTNPHEHIFEYNPDKGGWIRKGPSDF